MHRNWPEPSQRDAAGSLILGSCMPSEGGHSRATLGRPHLDRNYASTALVLQASFLERDRVHLQAESNATGSKDDWQKACYSAPQSNGQDTLQAPVGDKQRVQRHDREKGLCP